MPQYSQLNKKLPKVILIGKPNVGKSSLFNTIIGRKEAIVGDEIGLTRDYQEVKYTLDNSQITISDTAGISFNNKNFNKLSYNNTLEKIKISDLIFFLIDSSNELTNDDYSCAEYLRKYKNKVVLLANKSELKNSKKYKNQGFVLGFDAPIEITAKSKRCLTVINEIIKNFFGGKYFSKKKIDTNYEKKISLSITGKPNTGKSTIFNNIYGSKRVLVSSLAGTTRDSIKEEIPYKKNIYNLIDTAGIKKKSKAYKNNTDKSSNYFSRKEIRYANIVILVIDANLPFSNLELSIANYIITEGRAILLVFNKWDLVIQKEKMKKELISKINSYFFDIKNVPAIFISALNKDCKNIILDNVQSIYFKWNKKIKTSDLNQWLHSEFLDKNSNKPKVTKETKFRFLSQTKIRPPTFSLFCNTKKNINHSKIRFLKNKLREKFNLEGVPIRVNLKVSKNPYKLN